MQDITITVTEAGTAVARTYAYKIAVDGTILAERTITPVQTQQVQEMVSQYFTLQKDAAATAAKDYLPILGNMIYQLFFKADDKNLAASISSAGRLTVVSPIPEVLQLPWEMLSFSERPAAAGTDAEFSIIRLPGTESRLATAAGQPAPGPLRVLFLAAEPLDYEAEEQAMERISEGLDTDLAVCEEGTIEELKEKAAAFRPHLVALACQAKLSGGAPVLSMPGTSGRTALLKAEDLADALKDCGTVGIILSGRQSENPQAIHLLSRKLAENIPLAVAWNAPTSAGRPLYQSLAKGQSMDEAILAVRREAAAAPSSDQALVAAPARYSISDLPEIYSSRERAPAAAICGKLLSLPGLPEGDVDCFVDRRREIQQLSSALLDGRTQTAIITGQVGSGKSALATYFARQLVAEGYNILAVYGSPNSRISSARVIEAAAAFFSSKGDGALAGILKDPGRSIRDRQNILLETMKSARILMVWDDLALDSKSGRISDPNLGELYMQMLRGTLSGRLIITCEKMPGDALTLPARAAHCKLEGLGQAAFIRYLLQDRMIADRYKRAEITYSALAGHHLSEQGLPARLAMTAKALETADLAAGEDPLSRLIARLSSSSAHALCQAAAYCIAINQAGLAAVCGLPEEQAAANARAWQELHLAAANGNLWTVPSFLHISLLAKLSPEEQRAAQKSAGNFLRSLADAGRSSEIGLNRLDCMLEARGHYLAAKDADNAIAVTARISGYLKRHGYYSEIIRLNQELLDRNMPSAAPMAWIARAHLDQGEYRKAAKCYEQALQIAPDADAYYGLGTALMHQEKHDLARESLEKSTDAYRAAGDQSGEAASMSRLATIDMLKGENDAALEKLQKIAEVMRSLGDIRGEAATLQEMARLEMLRHDYDRARQWLATSKERLLEGGDRKGAAFSLFNLASLDLEKGEYSAAGAEFGEALPLFAEMGDRAGQAAILHSLGMIHSQAGEKEKAAESFQDALRINQDLGDKPAEAGALFQLGALAVQQDKMQEGLRLMALAAVVLRSIKSDDVKNVEPLVERLAAQLNLTQEQFMLMVQEILQSYVLDRGWGLVEKAWGKAKEK
ncbi:MAG: tetratricopeptide repeat protein [Methanothrix sp.]|nr:tetratricopeptide repeat protein [Methanothrix sp.]